MRSVHFPGTDLDPSVICLGTGGYGSSIPRDQSFQLLDGFFERGGSFLDSAHVYAAWIPNGAGASERTIGEWQEDRGVRDRIIIGTKGGHPELDKMRVPRLSPPEIERDLFESLERLRTDRIDLYWLHRDDPATPVDVIMDALNRHIQAGRVRAIGASNWTVQRIEKANSWAKGRNLSGFCASQIGWNLAVRNAGIDAGMGTLYMDEETFAWHRASGLAVTAFNAQANGFFSGQYGPNVTDESNGKVKAMMRRSYNPESFARLERAEAVAKRRGCTANQVAVAWLTSQPFLVVAIGAPKTTDQMEDTCGAGAIELTAEEVGFLERG